MSRSWNRRKGEPVLWYGRFVEFYLSGGPERSLATAFRTFKARHATGTGPARDFSRSQPPGEWTKQCAAWGWVERARAYDAYQAAQLQKAHADAIKKANEKHLVVVRNHFSKLIKQTDKVDYSGFTDMLVLLKAAKELIHLERMLLGMPLQIEEARRGPIDPMMAQAVQESSAAPVATPKMMAEVYKILDAQGAFADDEGRPDAASRSA